MINILVAIVKSYMVFIPKSENTTVANFIELTIFFLWAYFKAVPMIY